jgi:IgA Peptidase M64
MKHHFSALLIFFAAMVFHASAHAGSGHYIVVTVQPDGRAKPVFYRQVQLQAQPSSNTKSLALAKNNPDQLTVSGEGWSQVAEVPRYIRGEFAENGVSGEIDAHHKITAPDRSFAIRIPANAGDEINLNYLGIVTRLKMNALAATARHLPLADFPVANNKRAKAGNNAANRVDILVLGDGYTAAEQSTFSADAENLRQAMFDFTPYKEYASFVNWQTVFTASVQSGADHPPYQASCNSASCCSDSAAQSDPRAAGAGVFVNTAFDGKFCTSQIHRLVTINSSKVLAAASAYPDYDQLMVLINDSVYGGSGGSIAVTTTNGSARYIVIHEYGHTFHDLADEYTSPYPGFPACSDTGGGSPCEANVTNQTVPNLIKWKSWIAPTTPIPTTSGADIGLFQGARYLTSGIYRPANSCGMRNLAAPFCSVCSQAYILKLYSGGAGAPPSGIDLIEPGSEVPVASPAYAYNAGSTVNFSATILKPTPDTVTMQWYLDGVAQTGATSNSFDFSQAGASPVARTLELRVTDNSTLVKPEMAGTLMTHSRTWTINVASSILNLSIADVAVSEGNGGAKIASFDVSLNAPAPAAGVSFDMATYGMRSTGNAASTKNDYVPWGNTRKTIPAGQTSTRLNVKILGDRTQEPDEIFGVSISNVSGANLADGFAIGTIVNDDQASLLGVSNRAQVNPHAAAISCKALKTRSDALEKRVALKQISEQQGIAGLLAVQAQRHGLGCDSDRR